jgi:hypothetical protein
MPTHGHLVEFKASAGDWQSYMKQVEFYFDANEVTNAAKKSVCGNDTFVVDI